METEQSNNFKSSELDSSFGESGKARQVQIFISTGEVSGDLQGALLVTALFKEANRLNLELEIVGLGGERMAQAGAKILGNTTAIGSVGVVETLPFVIPTLKIQRQAKKYLEQHPPDLVVLIDYMQPNLTVGAYIKRFLPKVPIVYYIMPQEWICSLAPKNTERIVNTSDLLLAIFPEEARYFERHGGNVSWVGHPLVDRIHDFPSREAARASLGIADRETAIALIPASRPQELKYLLPVILESAARIQEQIPSATFWIPLSLGAYRETIEKAISQARLNVNLISDRVPEVLAAADLAITKSGTVNLELALLNVPQVVIYRVHPLTFWIGKNILRLKIPFMSPANLVLMRPIVPELLQDLASVDNIVQAAMLLLQDETTRQETFNNYREIRQTVGDLGVCDRAAEKIIALL